MDVYRDERLVTLFIAQETPGASQEWEVAFVDSMHDKPPDDQRFYRFKVWIAGYADLGEKVRWKPVGCQ